MTVALLSVRVSSRVQTLADLLNHRLCTGMIAVVRSMVGTVVLLPALVFFCAPLGALAATTKQVLILHSYNREVAPSDSILAAFRTELARTSSAPLALYDAYLGTEQAGGADDPQPFLDVLRQRFAKSPPDVVVTVGASAAAFYLQNRDKVFPGTPVVVAALEERLVPKSLLHLGDAVVAAHYDLTGAVDNILRVLPDTQRIAVVIGNAPVERFWLGDLRREYARFANRVTFEWFNDLSFEQMRNRVSALPPHSAVLFTDMVIDAAGVPHERSAALASLVEVSSAPIFGLHETDFGHGVVGGPYQSLQRRGKLMAATVLRALNGQTPADLAIQIGHAEPAIYDWRELKRWGIDPSRLPAGSEIRFRPPTLWDEHRALIMTALAIFVLQGTLLIGLVWQRLRRRRAEREALTLSGRLITAHEDERRWLARELHDDITQRLAGLAIAAARLPEGDAIPTELGVGPFIRGGLIRLSKDVHNLSYRLHPSVIDDLGLVAALKAECGRVARTESLRVDVEADKLPQNLPNEVTLGLYRVAQEALRNVGRHAKASIVKLSLTLSDDGLLLAVSDNGGGFEPDLQPRRPSLGHASMRERIRALGGRLDIRSAPGVGTTVVAWVPIAKAAS
jgi:signal transduction histidine kinase